MLPLAEGFGLGLRKIRQDAELTLEKVASAATSFGLKWSTARVVEFEKGKIPITLPTLMRLGTALTALVGRPVTLSALLGWDHWLELPGGGVIHADAFRQAFAGGGIDLRQGDQSEADKDEGMEAHALLDDVPPGLSVRQLRFMHDYARLADERAAKRLGMSFDRFLAFCFALLGTSLTEFRDTLLPSEANAQERGQFTRWATERIRAFAARYDDGDAEVVHLMSTLGDIWAKQQWRDPAIEADPLIQEKRQIQRTDRTRRALASGQLEAFGLSLLGIDQLANERWQHSELAPDSQFELLVLEKFEEAPHG